MRSVLTGEDEVLRLSETGLRSPLQKCLDEFGSKRQGGLRGRSFHRINPILVDVTPDAHPSLEQVKILPLKTENLTHAQLQTSG